MNSGRYNFAKHDPLLARGFQAVFQHAQMQIQDEVAKEKENDQASPLKRETSQRKGRWAWRNNTRMSHDLASGLKRLKTLLLQPDFTDRLHEATLGPTEGDDNTKLHLVRKFYKENLHENYYRTVQFLLHDISPRLELALLADYKIDSADLFIWATISGHFDSTRNRLHSTQSAAPECAPPARPQWPSSSGKRRNILWPWPCSGRLCAST